MKHISYRACLFYMFSSFIFPLAASNYNLQLTYFTPESSEQYTMYNLKDKIYLLNHYQNSLKEDLEKNNLALTSCDEYKRLTWNINAHQDLLTIKKSEFHRNLALLLGIVGVCIVGGILLSVGSHK